MITNPSLHGVHYLHCPSMYGKNGVNEKEEMVGGSMEILRSYRLVRIHFNTPTFRPLKCNRKLDGKLPRWEIIYKDLQAKIFVRNLILRHFLVIY